MLMDCGVFDIRLPSSGVAAREYVVKNAVACTLKPAHSLTPSRECTFVTYMIS